jgi:tyrosinase
MNNCVAAWRSVDTVLLVENSFDAKRQAAIYRHRSIAAVGLIAAIFSLTFSLSAQAQVRIRKNQAQLTPTEQAAFVDAMDRLYNKQSLEHHADHHWSVTHLVHSNTSTNINNPSWPNTSNATPYAELFLPWHRQSLLEFETELLAEDLASDTVPDLQGLPYWDFIADRTWGASGTSPFKPTFLGTGGVNTTVPFSSWTVVYPPSSPTLGAPNNIFPGKTEVMERGTALQQNGTKIALWGASGSGGTIPGLPTQNQLRAELANPTFGTTAGFSAGLENNIHNATHGAAGGQLRSRIVPTYDPAFWMLHANIDRIWASRQTVYGEGNTFTSTAPMPGFQTNVTPQQVLSISNMNYEYDSFVQFVPPEIIDDFSPDLGPHTVNVTVTSATPPNQSSDFEPIAPLNDTPAWGNVNGPHMGRTTSLIELTPAGGESVSVTSNPPNGVMNIASSANANGGVQLSYFNNSGDSPLLRLQHNVSNRSNSEGVVIYFDKPLTSQIEIDVVLRSHDPTIVAPPEQQFDAYELARGITSGSAIFLPFQLFMDIKGTAVTTDDVPFATASGQLPVRIDGMEFTFKVNNGDDFAIDRIEIGAPLPGFTQNAAVFPTNQLTGDPVFRYHNVASGRWFDPPRAEGYEYRLDSDSLFTDIGLPEGYGAADLSAVAADGSLIFLGHFVETQGTGGTAIRFGAFAAQLGATLEFDFVNGVSGIRAFQITGLNVDASDPGAFPLFINTNTAFMSFSQAPLLVPEPSVIALTVVGGMLSGFVARRPRRPRIQVNVSVCGLLRA